MHLKQILETQGTSLHLTQNGGHYCKRQLNKRTQHAEVIIVDLTDIVQHIAPDACH